MSHPINAARNRERNAEHARHVAGFASIGEILNASQPDPRSLPPVVRHYAQPGRRSLAARSLDAEPDPWRWAEKAAQ